MNLNQYPNLPIPEPLIVSEKGSFAYYTFTHRLPTILERVIAENNFSSASIARLKSLHDELFQGIIRPIKNDRGGDVQAWDEYVQPYLEMRWLDTPFYFAEAYFYRRLLEATEYYSIPIAERIDPFHPQKYGSLESVMNSVCTIAQQVNELSEIYLTREHDWKEALTNLLYLDLWGNRADLSLRPTEAGQFQHQRTTQEIEHILLNDATKIVNKLSSFNFERFDFIVDNAGFELISDLILIDFLLNSQVTEKIYIHLKAYPTFVSDAIIKDVQLTLEFLSNYCDRSVNALASRLQHYLVTDKLQLFDDYFWTSPLFFWQMPESLRKNLAQSDLIFIKGDANYRRLVGDCHWNKTSSFDDIVSYFPTSLVVLRTLKCEVIVGLSPEQIESVSREDADWLTNGNWGIIQLFEGIGKSL